MILEGMVTMHHVNFNSFLVLFWDNLFRSLNGFKTLDGVTEQFGKVFGNVLGIMIIIPVSPNTLARGGDG